MREDLLALYRAHVRDLTRRTRDALTAESCDAVVIHSGSLLKRSVFDDQYWPLRPVPHFQHWVHLPWPDCALVFTVSDGPRLMWLRDRSFWERPQEPDWSAIDAALPMSEMSSVEAFKDELPKLERVAFIGEDRARAGSWGFQADQVNPPQLLQALDELRVFKTPYEVACLDEANRIAALGHRAVKEAFMAGERRELALHLLYLEATRQDDPETPYKNIVAVGENAAILHHVHYRKGPSDTPVQSLLLDAGATFQGYASDITRTYAAGGDGAAITAFNQLIAGLEALQLTTCDHVRVGRPYEDLHDEAHQLLAGVLKDAGIVSASEAETVDSGVTRMFLPHGLGHSLGLQCHDVGCAKIKPRDDNPFLRNTRVIEPGQVFTIEPGIYFIDDFMAELEAGPQGQTVDWKLVEALKGFGGIRIEDDVVVKEGDAIDNLTRSAL